VKTWIASFLGGGGLVAIFSLVFSVGARDEKLTSIEKKLEGQDVVLSALDGRVRNVELGAAADRAMIVTRLDDIVRRLDRIERGR
jgi:hypothetical protein